MIEKISKMISNLKVLSKMNNIIDGLNTHTTNTNNPHNVTAEQLGLATAYVYKGSVTNFSDLPTNAQNGWVYSVENEHTDSAGILHPAGANFAWNGSKWDDLGGSLSGYAKSVNSQTPDSKGNVFLNLVESLEKNTEDKLIVHNADGTTQELELGKNYDNDLNNILDSITELETRVVPIEKGGTGATTVAEARKNLGLESTTEVIPISHGGTGATTAADARTNLGIGAGQLVPAGFIAPYGGTSVPSGWLACNGAAVSRTTYANLFAVIGTTYGTGDGSTTFNLPNASGNKLVTGEVTASGKATVYGTGSAFGLTQNGSGLSCFRRYPTSFWVMDNTGQGNTGVNMRYPTSSDSAAKTLYADMSKGTISTPSVSVTYCIKY